MSKTMREKWAASFLSDKELWKLSENGEVAEYMSRDKPNGDPYGRAPIFHVWAGDQWLYCGPSQEKADRVYREAVAECTTVD